VTNVHGERGCSACERPDLTWFGLDRDRWSSPIEDLLVTSPRDIASVFRLEDGDVKELVAEIARKFMESRGLAKCLGTWKTSDLRFSTGDPGWDAFLEGGLPFSGITEIVGPAGSGKTQLALQLALAAQTPKDLGGLAGSKSP
jgi:predicted ATP-dependent serine protease